MIAAIVAPTRGEQVEHADDYGQRRREPDAEQRQRDVRDEPGDHADRDVPGDVAGHRSVNVGAEPAQPLLLIGAPDPVEAVRELRSVAQEKEPACQDGDELRESGECPDRNRGELVGDAREPAGELARFAFQLRGELVLVVVLAERRVLAQVADARGELADARVDLPDDRGNGDEAEEEDRREQCEVSARIATTLGTRRRVRNSTNVPGQSATNTARTISSSMERIR
jgi:hypothetical protein